MGVFDNPAGIFQNIPVLDNRAGIGDANNPLDHLAVKDLIVTGSETAVGDQVIDGTVTADAFLLADGSDKNYVRTVYAAGTAYSLTATPAALDFGTTDPVVVLNKAGTYAIRAKVRLNYVGPTFAASRTVTIKLRRTNNTAADLTNGTEVVLTAIVTTVTATFMEVVLPEVIYTTANIDDSITLFGDVSATPSAGSLDAVAASIVAVRLYA